MQIRLSLLQILQFFIWGSWFVTGGTYMIQTLGFSGREVGLVYLNFSIAATVTPLFMGVLADRLFSAEKLLAVLHVLGGGLLFLASTITDFTWFNIVILLHVLCYLPTFALSNSLCFHHIEDSKKDYPKVRVWGTVSWIVASFMVSYLNIENQVTPFVIAASCSVFQAAYCLTLPSTPPTPRPKTNFLDSIIGPEIRELFKEKSFAILVICIGLICIPLSYYYSFVNPFLNEIGVENAAAKMSIGQMVEIVLLLTLPWFFKVWRFKTIIFLGMFVWGARYGLFILGYQYDMEWLLIIGIAVHGIAYIFSMLSAQIYLDSIVPTHLRSTAQGFFSLLTMGLMALVGTTIAGETVNAFTNLDGSHNWDMIWVFPFVFGILVSFAFLFFFRSKIKA